MLTVIILAAGKGKRMLSDQPKVLQPLGGAPMLRHIFELSLSLSPKNILLVGSQEIRDFAENFSKEHPVTFILQSPPEGTGHAVSLCLPYLKDQGQVLILCGDTPLIKPETLNHLMEFKKVKGFPLIVVGMRPKHPCSYGRLVVDENQCVQEIVEARHAPSSLLASSLCNSGAMLMDVRIIRDLISTLPFHPETQEFYVTDLVKKACDKGYLCGFYEGDAQEFIGINTKEELALAEESLQKRWRQQAFCLGVRMLAPETVFLSYDTKLARDVTLYPFIVLGPGVKIEKGATIRSFCCLEHTFVGEGCFVGPFAHLRQGTHLDQDVQIGNFVETKHAHLGKNVKAKHMTYLGDAIIGEKTNIGAGVVTCNFNGFTKSPTFVGQKSFLGAGSLMVAPIKIGEECVIGAGSILKKDVPDGALSFSKKEQVIKEQGGVLFREKHQKKD